MCMCGCSDQSYGQGTGSGQQQHSHAMGLRALYDLSPIDQEIMDSQALLLTIASLAASAVAGLVGSVTKLEIKQEAEEAKSSGRETVFEANYFILTLWWVPSTELCCDGPLQAVAPLRHQQARGPRACGAHASGSAANVQAHGGQRQHSQLFLSSSIASGRHSHFAAMGLCSLGTNAARASTILPPPPLLIHTHV